jgi:hypothetical protein
MYIPIGVAVLVAGVLMIRFLGSWVVGGVTTAVGLCMVGVGIPLLSPLVHQIQSLF